MNASLNEKLNSVEWGEYQLGDLFDIKTGRDVIVRDLEDGNVPLISHQFDNNGIVKRIKRLENRQLFDYKKTIPVADRGIFHASNQTENFHIGTRVKALIFKDGNKTARQRLFFVSAINMLQIQFTEYSENATDDLPNLYIMLPKKGNVVDYEFMEKFIAELGVAWIEEQKSEQEVKLSAYLKASGLDDYELNDEEKVALNNYNSLKCKKFNLEALFGKSTRGKRLKSEDRTLGALPFVTAGEAYEGVSAFIGNTVEVFSSNTTTIDMFGSAKYRNYKYGGDDHIAVVHTEKLSKNAAIFVTAAIHKSSHNGQFNYGKNFYAKDADELNIVLPIQNGKPDFKTMETLISAIHKLVIKDVVLYADKKMKAVEIVAE